jgi:amino acid transporter
MDAYDDDRAVIEAGYKPQLKRSLGFFASFAIPFSVISITTGIFANYNFVLGKAGPFGFWTWLLVSAGHIAVALVFAEMAGRIPLTGSIYNWNNRLLGPAAGFLTGWLAISNYTIGAAAVTTVMLPILGVILGHEISGYAGSCLVSAFLVVQMMINLFGVRLTSHTNVVAVVAEIMSIVVLSCLIVFAVAHKGHFHFDYLTTIPSEPRPYWPAFLMASLLGAWTLIGFETSADISEETINARRIAPKGVIASILASVIIGFVFIVVMTLAIPDLATISKAPYPLAAIAAYYLGDTVTTVFLIFSLVAIFSCSLVCLTAGSRVLYAMARDGRFVAAPLFSRVSAHHVPKYALVFVTGVCVIFVFISDSIVALSGAATVCASIYYLITVVGFALKGGKMPKTATFSLKRWHWPVVFTAAGWLIVEIGILTIPEEFHPVAVATCGVLVAGIVLYVIAGRVKRG